MNKISIIGWFCSLALFVWLLVIAFMLRSEDYFTLESLFYIAKAQIVHDGYFPKLPTIGITYPVVAFQIVLILFPVFGIMSPMVASSAGVTIIFGYLWQLSKRADMHPLFFVGLTLFFFLNPGMIYLAISGASSYMMILVILGLFYHLLKYIEQSDTYNIAMAGLFYMLLIFVDFTFIWLFIFILPVILLITSRNLEFQNIFEVQGFKAFFREGNMRKAFIGKSLSTAFMFTILPISSFLLYLFVNHLFTSHIFDFLDNANYNYRLIQTRAIGNVTSVQQDFFFLRNFYDFLVIIFAISPFLIKLIFSSFRQPLKLYIILLPVFIILFNITRENLPILATEFFMLLCVTCLFGIIQFKRELMPRWLTGFIVILMSLISIWFTHKYFQYESTTIEGSAYELTIQKAPDVILRILTGSEEDHLLRTSEDSPFRRSTSSGRTVESVSVRDDFLTERNRAQETSSETVMGSSMILDRSRQMDFRFDLRVDGFQDITALPDLIYGGTNPNLQAAMFLREITSGTARVLADDGTAFPVVALHGRIRDFSLPYENDYITFISNPQHYVRYILIPSRENFYQNFDMVYNVAPGLGTPDIPYRILFDNNEWMILEAVNVLAHSRAQFSSVLPQLPKPEPFHSVVLVTNDQSAFAQQNLRRLRSQIDHLQIIPVYVESDGNQWIRWKVTSGRFDARDSAVLWRISRLPNQIYHYYYHSEIDNRLFNIQPEYTPDEPTWSLFFGRFNTEEDAQEALEAWNNFGLTEIRMEFEDGYYLLLAGKFNDFIAAELLAHYLSLQSYQRITLHELPVQSDILSGGL